MIYGYEMNEVQHCFHGSLSHIEQFEDSLLEDSLQNYGAGIYFSSSGRVALRHCDQLRKVMKDPGRALFPTLLEVELKIANPLVADSYHPFSVEQATAILLASPNLNAVLANFGDLDFEDKGVLIERAASGYAAMKGPLLETLKNLGTDFFSGSAPALLKALRDILGFDGVLAVRADDTCWVAWFPEQISIKKRLHLTLDEIHEAC